MQKYRHSKRLSLIAGMAILLISEFAMAGIISLPRYTGEFAYRTGLGGRDKVTLSCSPGGVEKQPNQVCTGPFSRGGKLCYKECHCAEGYKAGTTEACVAKTCEDYNLVAIKDPAKSCSSVSQKPNLACYECVDCDDTVYKYKCNGSLENTEQGAGNKCGDNYSRCSCVENAVWNQGIGKCECKTDYKESNGSCLLMECLDYKAEYQIVEDKAKECRLENPRPDLECWSCVDCDAAYKYPCTPDSTKHIKGGKGDVCGQKFKECECDSALYSWDNGACTLNCTRNSCSAALYPLDAQNAAHAASYEECVPSCSDESNRYKISACNSGFELINGACVCLNKCALAACPAGTICEQEVCSNKYCAVGCKENYVTPFSFIYLFYLF